MKRNLEKWSAYAPGLIFIALGLLIVAFPMLLVIFVSAFLVLVGIGMLSIARKVNTLRKESGGLFDEEPLEFERIYVKGRRDIF
jgi:hypothetical protein